MTSKKHASPNRPPAAPKHGHVSRGEFARGMLLAGTMAIFVGRPLVPCEGAAWLGDGMPWVMIGLVITALVLLAALADGRLAVPLAKIDAAVLVLIAWHTLAALAVLRVGSPRPAVNMLWEWIGLGTGYFCLRQLVRSAAEMRCVVAALIALATGLSVLGEYQFAFEMPAMRAEYARDPEAVLAKSDFSAPAGSPQRKLFEDRLQSTEPMGTFALTNSLAGLIVPWLVCVVALTSTAARAPAWRSGVLAAVMALCLLLTKSRSGYVGALVGAGLLAVLSPPGRRWLTPRRWRNMGLAAMVLVVGAFLRAGSIEPSSARPASRSAIGCNIGKPRGI